MLSRYNFPETRWNAYQMKFDKLNSYETYRTWDGQRTLNNVGESLQAGNDLLTQVYIHSGSWGDKTKYYFGILKTLSQFANKKSPFDGCHLLLTAMTCKSVHDGSPSLENRQCQLVKASGWSYFATWGIRHLFCCLSEIPRCPVKLNDWLNKIYLLGRNWGSVQPKCSY